MPTQPITNGTLHYFEHAAPDSSFPPLLLIHGGGGRYTHWPPHVRRLKGVTVYALDLPAHGESTGCGRETIAGYAADIREFLDALGIEQVIIGGHSMGGAIAQQMALDYPDRVAGLILIGTGAKMPVTPRILDHALDDFEGVVNFIIGHMYGQTASEALIRLGHDILASNPPEVLLGDFAACNAFDSRPRLTEIGVPALVLGGADDRMMPEKFSVYLAENLPDAEMHIFDNCGHMIMSEFPAEVAGIIGDWLRWNFGHGHH